MRILTWNINSVRLRMGLLLRVMEEYAPDIVCLQETKTRDETFPLSDVERAGYLHTHIHGMKSYNGVAILSKKPFLVDEIHHRCGNEDCRHISVHMDVAGLGKPLQIHCLYIPAGGDEPDPQINDKFAHKLAFVEEMTAWFSARFTPEDPLVALGDFNIAPLENDVWSHRQLLKVVSHTPPETERLQAMKDSLGWIDAVRHYVPPEEKLYSWWSYRARDWEKSDRGRRLDHIWITPPLLPFLRGQIVARKVRGWPQPSDHVPVLIDLDVC